MLTKWSNEVFATLKTKLCPADTNTNKKGLAFASPFLFGTPEGMNPPKGVFPA